MNSQKEIDQFVKNCFDENAVKVLESLDNGINQNAVISNGQTPLTAAINGENLEIVSCLITWMADLNLFYGLKRLNDN